MARVGGVKKGDVVATVQGDRNNKDILAMRVTVQTQDTHVGVDMPQGMVARYRVDDGGWREYTGGEIQLTNPEARKSIFSFRKKQESAPKTVTFVLAKERVLYEEQWGARDTYTDERGDTYEITIRGWVTLAFDIGNSEKIFDEVLTCPSGYMAKPELDSIVHSKLGEIRNFLANITHSWIMTLPPSSQLASRMTYLQRNIMEKSRGLAGILAPYSVSVCDVKLAAPQWSKVNK